MDERRGVDPVERLEPADVERVMRERRREGQLRAHGFFGGRVREGWALRVLFRNGRTFHDLVLFEPSESDRWGTRGGTGEVVELSCTSFPIESESGPVVVIDRIVSSELEDPCGWVELVTSDVLDVQDDPGPQPRMPMAAEEFWDLIALLGGEISDESIGRLVDGLMRLSHAEITGFRDALVERLHDLDHPGNTVRLGIGGDEVVSADASLYYRCEIVARGPHEFARRVADPRVGGGDDGAWGEALLSVADDAADRPVPLPRVPFETGTNTTHWPGVARAEPKRARDEPAEAGPSAGPFSYEAQLKRLNILPGSAGSLISFVAYATTEHSVRELMGCALGHSVADARAEIVEFLNARLDPAEQLHPNVIVYRHGVSGVTHGVSMTGATRKSRLTTAQFIDRYFHAKADNA